MLMKYTIQRDEYGHIIPNDNRPYNERLFSNDWRGYFHRARFQWLFRIMKKLSIEKGSVLELGCFDGKTLEYLPFAPSLYYGYDADWEGGLQIAANKWKNHSTYYFFKSVSPDTFNPANNQFDYTIVMETFEHLPSQQLYAYFEKLKAATRCYLFVTIPIEKGLLAVMKYLIKRIFLQADERYSANELWHVLIGKLDKVRRVELGHKGFDHDLFINELSKYFKVIRKQRIPFAIFSFSLCLVAKPL